MGRGTGEETAGLRRQVTPLVSVVKHTLSHMLAEEENCSSTWVQAGHFPLQSFPDLALKSLLGSPLYALAIQWLEAA